MRMPDIAEIIKILKAVVTTDLPGWKKEYYQRLRNNLQVHTKGLLFSKVDTLFPNEHPDSKVHCVNTYEPITKGSIWKAINDISRIFSNSSFSLSASDATIEYLQSSSFDNSNLFNWFLGRWIDNTVALDANSLCAVYPKEYVTKWGGDAIRFISSMYVRVKNDDLIAFISDSESAKEETTENTIISREIFYDENVGNINAKKSVVKTYNLQVSVKITNPVYHVFTKTYLLRFWKENVSDQEFKYEYFLFENSTIIPCFNTGGTEIYADIKESFVAPFIPFGNLALLQHRNHRAVDLMFSYPRMSEVQTPCDNNCVRSNLTGIYMSGDTACARCKGVGFITVQSPYKVYQKRTDGGLMTDEAVKTILSTPPVEFYTPDVSILNYSKDSWKEYLGMAEEAVFVVQKKVTADAESAESKRIDYEGKYAWLINITKVYFETLRSVCQACENYIVNNPIEVTIEAPKSLAILTEAESFEELNNLMVSDAPVMIKAQQVDNFIQKFVAKSSPVVKAMRILRKFDPLLYYSNKDVQIFKSNNTIKPESWTNHIYAYPVLIQLYDADKTLFDKDDDTIMQQLNEGIALLAPAPAQDLKTAILNSITP